MGRDGYYWSVDDCRWVPCPPLVVPEQATPADDDLLTQIESA